MLRRLQTRPPVDIMINEPRRTRPSVARWVYLIGLLALALWLGDLFFGGLFYLRSEGLVVGEHGVVAAEFPVTVRDLRVHDGGEVHAGDVVAVVSSQNVAEALARLIADVAAQESKLSELRIRDQTISAVIDFATTRQQVAVDARHQLETLQAKGYLSIDKRTAAVESEYRSRENLETLRAQHRGIGGEIATLDAALVDARTAIAKLQSLYDDGKMHAPIAGIATSVAAYPGAVLPAGAPLLDLYASPRFILAYMPSGGLTRVAVGDRVRIRAGLRTAFGMITRIEPVAAALPREFQRAFAPVDRQQLMRVDLAAGEPPWPLFTKVQLRSSNVLDAWIGNIVGGWIPGAD